MTFAYIIIGGVSGLAASKYLPRYIKKESLLSLAIVASITVVLIFSKIVVIPVIASFKYSWELKKEEPVFKLIAAKFPDEYAAYIQQEKKNILNRTRENAELVTRNNFLSVISTKTLPQASNETICNFYQLQVQLDQVLLNVDPTMMLTEEFPNKFKKATDPPLLVLIIGAPLYNSVISRKEAMIESALTHPEQPLTPADKEMAMRELRSIMDNLALQFGGRDNVIKMVSTPENPSVDKRQAALLMLQFYKDILANSIDTAGTIFKYLVLSYPS